MKCINPYCNYAKTYTTNSRGIHEGKMHLRRLACPKCNTRYTTYESILYDERVSHWFEPSNEDIKSNS